MTEETSLSVKDLSLFYGQKQALANINMEIATRKVTAFIGPSGCGKSTLLRCFNRMNDLIDDVSITGDIEFEERSIYDEQVDVANLRRKIGMVFQRPNPFPKSIYENVAYGLRLQGETAKAIIDERVEWALKSAALWEEVKDRLKDSALGLSGGQQQRLVIARAIAIRPLCAAARRASVSTRPDIYAENRRTHSSAERRLHHRHRYPQHATSGTRIGLHGFSLFG